MIKKAEFITRINNLPKQIPSKTGTAFYTGFSVQGDTLHFHRVNTGNNWNLKIDVLWEIYATQKFINTTVVKNITGGKVNSPSVAILMAIGCLDKYGNRY